MYTATLQTYRQAHGRLQIATEDQLLLVYVLFKLENGVCVCVCVCYFGQKHNKLTQLSLITIS